MKEREIKVLKDLYIRTILNSKRSLIIKQKYSTSEAMVSILDTLTLDEVKVLMRCECVNGYHLAKEPFVFYALMLKDNDELKDEYLYKMKHRIELSIKSGTNSIDNLICSEQASNTLITKLPELIQYLQGADILLLAANRVYTIVVDTEFVISDINIDNLKMLLEDYLCLYSTRQLQKTERIIQYKTIAGSKALLTISQINNSILGIKTFKDFETKLNNLTLQEFYESLADIYNYKNKHYDDDKFILLIYLLQNTDTYFTRIKRELYNIAYNNPYYAYDDIHSYLTVNCRYTDIVFGAPTTPNVIKSYSLNADFLTDKEQKQLINIITLSVIDLDYMYSFLKEKGLTLIQHNINISNGTLYLSSYMDKPIRVFINIRSTTVFYVIESNKQATLEQVQKVREIISSLLDYLGSITSEPLEN